MTEQYLTLFYETCIALIPLVIPVLATYLMMMFIGNLFFDRR